MRASAPCSATRQLISPWPKLAAPPASLSASLPASVEPTQILKQVTILFLDVVGFTALSQRLDPETIGAVMDDALTRGTTLVQDHGRRVLQYAGDNILAAFGADGSREDGAERAVHCGLALLALGTTLSAEVLAVHDHNGFNIRVGIRPTSVIPRPGLTIQKQSLDTDRAAGPWCMTAQEAGTARFAREIHQAGRC